MKRFLLMILAFVLFGAVLGAGSAVLQWAFDIYIPTRTSTIVTSVIMVIVLLVLEFRKFNKCKEV